MNRIRALDFEPNQNPQNPKHSSPESLPVGTSLGSSSSKRPHRACSGTSAASPQVKEADKNKSLPVQEIDLNSCSSSSKSSQNACSGISVTFSQVIEGNHHKSLQVQENDSTVVTVVDNSSDISVPVVDKKSANQIPVVDICADNSTPVGYTQKGSKISSMVLDENSVVGLVKPRKQPTKKSAITDSMRVALLNINSINKNKFKFLVEYLEQHKNS